MSEFYTNADMFDLVNRNDLSFFIYAYVTVCVAVHTRPTVLSGPADTFVII